MNAHPKPARVDLGDGDSLILFRTDDYHTTVRFHSANPNTSLAGAVMATDALRAALDKITPAESPDLADGGVTCAAIENETLTNEARNEQARIDHIHEQDRIIRRRNEQLAEARADLIVAERREQEFADRADKAERALADVHERDETVARLEAQLVKAEQGWAKANDRNARQAEMLAEAECHDYTRDTAVITDEAIGRFRTHMWEAHDVDLDPADAVDAITAALTPEPQRPEGAEEIAALLEDMPADLIGGPLTAHEARTLADHLAERGVRVPNLDGHLPACEGGPGLPCDTCGSYWAGDAEEES